MGGGWGDGVCGIVSYPGTAWIHIQFAYYIWILILLVKFLLKFTSTNKFIISISLLLTVP